MQKKRKGHKKKLKEHVSKHPTKHENHPIFIQDLTAGEKLSDRIANVGGSWGFIVGFFVFLFVSKKWHCRAVL